MKKVIIIVAVVVAFVGAQKLLSSGGVVASSDNSKVVSEKSDVKIEIEKNDIDLGDIPIRGGKVDATFSFRNTGSETIRLSGGETSCMCTEAIIKKSSGEVSPRIKMQGHGSTGRMNMEIAPGETATLIATFDPMAHGPNATGPIVRDIIVTTNSKTMPEIDFTFRGNVIR